MHRRGLMRFKNSFSLLSWKVKKLFLPFFCKIFVSVFSIWTAKNIFFPFFVKIHLPWYLKCARARCKTCSFSPNVEKMSGPKRSIKITDHFTCTSANVIYCIACTLCKKLYIVETGRPLGDLFREHFREVEKEDKNAFKPVARHFNLSNHSSNRRQSAAFSYIKEARKAAKP